MCTFLVTCAVASGVGFKLELCKWCPAELSRPHDILSSMMLSSPQTDGNNITQSCYRRQKILSDLIEWQKSSSLCGEGVWLGFGTAGMHCLWECGKFVSSVKDV